MYHIGNNLCRSYQQYNLEHSIEFLTERRDHLHRKIIELILIVLLEPFL